MTKLRPLIIFTFTMLVTLNLIGQSPVVVNEIMASNDATMMDEAGEFDDWIELHNLSSLALNLGGFYLSDNPEDSTKWMIPIGTSIEGNGYLIIWLDDDEEQDGLHATFKLSAGGENVILINPDLEFMQNIEFGEQETDVAFARDPNGTGDFVKKAPTFAANNDLTSSLFDSEESSDIKVFPNPVSDLLNLSMIDYDYPINQLEIRDYLGQSIFQSKVKSAKDFMSLDISTYPNGPYVLIINDKYTRRFIIKK